MFNKLSNDIQVDRHGTCGSLVFDVKSLGNYWNLKNRGFLFSGTERVNKLFAELKLLEFTDPFSKFLFAFDYIIQCTIYLHKIQCT